MIFLQFNQLILQFYLFLAAILLVTSYVGHSNLRSDHRKVLSGTILRRLNLMRVFLLAKIPDYVNSIEQESIEEEHRKFNDILQGVDSTIIYSAIVRVTQM